jgi:SAM-dependent methyltransferase
MKWVAKAALHKVFSALPRSEEFNYFFQRRILHSLPLSEAAFLRKVTTAVWHYKTLAEHSGRDLNESVFYEFGAGWDLAIPLTFQTLGVDHQVLVDIRPNLRYELVANSLGRFRKLEQKISEVAGQPLRLAEKTQISSEEELERMLGISYLAPRDARATQLESASIDFITSTDTLEHVPAPDIAVILRECKRILRPDGLASFRIDPRDHYADFDSKISVYNFLSFSDRRMALVNSGIQYQNRLRRSDYLGLIEGAGFDVIFEEASAPSEAELVKLKALELAPRFKSYEIDDLAVKILRLVIRPKS